VATLDINTGRTAIVRAPVVVVATGGASTIYRVSSPAREKTGDGMAMCLRAGAELRDIEMMHFLSTGLAAAPSRLSGMLLAEVFRRIGGHLTKAEGARFMADYEPETMEAAPTNDVVRAAYREIQAGRGSSHGGVNIDVSHLGAELLEDRFPDLITCSRLVGSDLTTGPVEVSPVSHFHIGGVSIDADCQTTVPGLLVAGEDAGGVHGAGWTGGNGIAEATIFGARAGRRAAALASARRPADVSNQRIADTIAGHLATLGREAGESPTDLAADLKEAMWHGAGPVRAVRHLVPHLQWSALAHRRPHRRRTTHRGPRPRDRRRSDSRPGRGRQHRDPGAGVVVTATDIDRAGLRTWILLRLTGLVLSVLVLGHFALTHIINDVAETDAAFVADRFGNGLFIAWDAVMLLTALIHGAAGLWIIVGEQSPHRARRWRGALVGTSSLLAVLGVAVLIVAR
jgi:aspartate oxidase/succinate dehydrogenase hydrophobic anchor subunit